MLHHHNLQKATPLAKTHRMMHTSLRLFRPFFAELTLYPTPKSCQPDTPKVTLPVGVSTVCIKMQLMPDEKYYWLRLM